MPITKAKKKEILDEIGDAVKTSQSMVFAKFHGLTVAQADSMRSSMKSVGVSYKVARKTLLKRALQEGNFTGEQPILEGEIAIAWANDLIAPARETQKFSKEFKDKVSIVGGVFEGRFMNQSEMMEIATIPDLLVLRGMFVNVINSPIQGFVVALNAIAEKKA